MASINDCRTIQPRLSEYVDGALPDDLAWGVKMHLASCAVCARVAADLSATARLLGSLPRRETPAGFEEALARRLADQVLRPRRLSLGERLHQGACALRGVWSLPRVRPALATAGALAAIVPAAFLTTRHFLHPARPVPATAASEQQERQFVEQCLDEHAAYAAADPLDDPAAVILAASTK